MLADIDSELSTIQTGRYGEDIRTAIKDAISKVNNAGYMPVVENLNVVENGTYTPSSGVNGFSKVVVNVPTASAVLQSLSVTANGNYTPPSGVDGYNSVSVNVPSSGYPEPTGTVQITENGTVNVKDYASANVDVPNSYDATDEGKVVSSGALVAQTSLTVTQNGTYDTTENNEVVVDVSEGGENLSLAKINAIAPIVGIGGLYGPLNSNNLYVFPCTQERSFLTIDTSIPFEIGVTFRIAQHAAGSRAVFGPYNDYNKFPEMGPGLNGKIIFAMQSVDAGSNRDYVDVDITPDGYDQTPLDTDIFVRCTFDGTNTIFYFDDGTVQNSYTVAKAPKVYTDVRPTFGGFNTGSYSLVGNVNSYLNFENTYIKIDGSLVWGKQA